MVKRLDEKAARGEHTAAARGKVELPEHVGWLLWQAGNLWLQRFVEEMQQAGHAWFGPAQARLMGYIDRRGVAQRALVEKAPMTKQAVNQLLAELEREGVIVRAIDPDDRRARIVRYTDKGLAALADADLIKGRIEAQLAQALSARELETTKRRLAALARALDADD